MAAPLDPPSYSVEDVLRDEHDLLNDHAFRNNALAQSPQPPPSPPLETQLVIAPVHDDMSFQKGYLGVDGEHAAIEGEIQLKVAIGDHDWDRLTVELTTTEITPSGFVELSRTQRELWQRSASASTSTNTGPSRPPAVLPFSLPLMQDAPQCVHTPHSSLEHALTAVLHGGERSLRRTLTVHTRRFASPSDAVLPVAPETRVSDAPTRLEVQIPRLAYRAGEAIPVYVTVPPPSPTLILSEGIRLRNIRAELIQVVRIPKGADENSSAEWTPPEPPRPPPSETGTVSTDEDEDDEDDDDESSSSEEDMPIEKTALFDDGVEQPDPQTAQHTARVAISGAACRFHRSRSVRIRLVLHPSRTALGPSYGFSDEPPACAHGISQRAVLHSVSYRLVVTAAFLVTTGISSRSERLARISFPVEVLPPPAPTIPEEEPALEGAYRKKHDRPPTRTVRRADAEGTQPEPGPSDPPPPFEGTGDGLPTFLESEAAQGTSSSYHHSSTPDPDAEVDADAGPPEDVALFDGEGVLFGFPAAEQYDGLSLPLEMRRESLPPDLAMLLNARTAGRAGEILMDAPPPPMDDPSDPPPTIDAVSFAAPPAGIRRPSFAAGTLAHPLVAMTMDEPPPTIDASFSTTLEAPPTIDASFTSPPTIDASFAAPRAPPPAIDAASFHAPPAVGVEEAQTPIEPPPYLNRAQQEQRDREAHRDAGPPPYADLVR